MITCEKARNCFPRYLAIILIVTLIILISIWLITRWRNEEEDAYNLREEKERKEIKKRSHVRVINKSDF